MNLIDTPTHAKSHKIRVWSIRERGIHINNSFQATPWSSFTMICYAECFNTLINIFKVFHEPLLEALLPFIEHSAFQQGKLRPAPQTQGWAAGLGVQRKNQDPPKLLRCPHEWGLLLLKSKTSWNKLHSLVAKNAGDLQRDLVIALKSPCCTPLPRFFQGKALPITWDSTKFFFRITYLFFPTHIYKPTQFPASISKKTRRGCVQQWKKVEF